MNAPFFLHLFICKFGLENMEKNNINNKFCSIILLQLYVCIHTQYCAKVYSCFQLLFHNCQLMNGCFTTFSID